MAVIVYLTGLLSTFPQLISEGTFGKSGGALLLCLKIQRQKEYCMFNLKQKLWINSQLLCVSFHQSNFESEF